MHCEYHCEFIWTNGLSPSEAKNNLSCSADSWVKYSATGAAFDVWQIWTRGQKTQCNSEGIRPDKNAFGKIKRSVLLHSNVLRCVILQMILYSLKGR